MNQHPFANITLFVIDEPECGNPDVGSLITYDQHCSDAVQAAVTKHMDALTLELYNLKG